MPCFGPLAAYYAKERNPNGKRSLVFRKDDSNTGVKLLVPCGRCSGCRLERVRQWAMRCMHEKRMYDSSAFLTLTYDDKHLPLDGSLSKDEFVLFMKRLRHETGDGLRFYGCGEYGDVSGRPHYHVLLFNFDFADKRAYKTTKAGFQLFTSVVLDRIWRNGQCFIGSVDFDSCAYVARYVMKKVIGKDTYDASLYDYSTGVVREPEFTLMSRRPGLGTGYYEKYGSEVYRRDSVVLNGREMRPPRFYDGKLELDDVVRLAKIKELRRRVALSKPRSEGSSRRLRVRELVAEAKMSLKGRTL